MLLVRLKTVATKFTHVNDRISLLEGCKTMEYISTRQYNITIVTKDRTYTSKRKKTLKFRTYELCV